ncbi:ABC transporter substrate-binding protein [Methylophaga sp. OBS4]|uniref:ABC transporter substrate-binding protein n=1 Tax=Methylophaga sp. OBS4 TaxID=2991935 RepID=UPI00224EE2EB|nr:helical backbone metal receptor [Methylophaga sp. OBS4]MCX4188198.1 helical backbone metal receptor [Methylophaga sp. OBS4]
MRRFWPLLLFVVMLAVVLLRPDNEQSLPATDADHHYQRIISLSPSITEMVFAIGLGNRLIAVTDYCDYPPAAKALPKVGGYVDTSLEAVVVLQPDLVIMLKGQQKLQQQLQQLGISTHSVDNSTLLGIQAAIASIGNLTGQQQQAETLLEDIQQQINSVTDKVAGLEPVRTLISIAHYVNSEQLDTVYVAGQNDFYNDLLLLAGGENVFTSRHIMVPSISAEGIIRMNPDVIIDVFPEQDDHYSDMQQVKKQWQTLSHVNAVKSGRVHIIQHSYASVPGPRIFRLLPEFAQLLHPNLDWDENQFDD